MIPGHSPPRQSAAYRAIAAVGGTAAAVVVIGFVVAVASIPRPPRPGAQPNDSASGASAGTRPSAAARVSRPRTAA
ncbi:hypothetical protein K388_01249 [Streptomyces sp. KhCrAH-43]|nr:hypothetical protein K388_01249 [Streptomyces sp. KhCrAH-43]